MQNSNHWSFLSQNDLLLQNNSFNLQTPSYRQGIIQYDTLEEDRVPHVLLYLDYGLTIKAF